MNGRSMVEGQHWKHIVRFAFPVLLGSLLQLLSTYIPLFGLYQGMGHNGFPTIVATCALGVRV